MTPHPLEHLQPQQGPSRCPKLSYRTKSGDAVSVSTISTGSSNPASPLQSDFCPSPRFPPSLASDTSISSSSTGPFSTSTTSLPSKPPPQVSKKRSGFLSGLLGAKEPSAQALADYQKHLLKQGNGRVTAVGLPGVSSAKLPPTVPKVNSKWDGVPQTVKEREKYQENAKRQSTSGLHRTFSSTNSMRSDARAGSTPTSRRHESRGGSSTHSSNSSRNNLAGLYGWEVRGHSSGSSQERDFAVDRSRPSTSETTFCYDAPTLQRDSTFPPRELPEIVRTEPERSSPATPPEHSTSPNLTPCDPSPLTPEAPSTHSVRASPGQNSNMDDYFKATVFKVPEFDTEIIVKSAGVNVLGPPATAKRRPKPFINQFDEEGREIQEFDFQLNSTLKREPAASKETPSPRPAPACSTSNGRKGLGLAMNLKNQGSAPSLSPRPTAHDSIEEERNTTPTPEGGQSRRKNRPSLFTH